MFLSIEILSSNQNAFLNRLMLKAEDPWSRGQGFDFRHSMDNIS